MNRRDVIETLCEHKEELQAAGVMHIHIFGSAARNEESDTSDLDLLADFDPSKHLTLVTVGHLQSRLTKMLGRKVDLSSTAWMKEPIRSKATQEAVLAF